MAGRVWWCCPAGPARRSSARPGRAGPPPSSWSPTPSRPGSGGRADPADEPDRGRDRGVPGSRKQIRPVTIATYQVITTKRGGVHPHLELFDARDWGLIIYDEVHLLPAPVFRMTADLQARRRLGLTATLVREDGREGDVFSLIGPSATTRPGRTSRRRATSPGRLHRGAGHLGDPSGWRTRWPSRTCVPAGLDGRLQDRCGSWRLVDKHAVRPRW